VAVTSEAITEQLNNEADLLTVDQLARRLDVPKSWIYRQCRLKEKTGFPVEKYGKYNKFDYQKVRQWAAQR
jgi:hypothetical protein